CLTCRLTLRSGESLQARRASRQKSRLEERPVDDTRDVALGEVVAGEDFGGMLEVFRIGTETGFIEPPVAGLFLERPSLFVRAGILLQQPNAFAIKSAAFDLLDAALVDENLQARVRGRVARGRGDYARRLRLHRRNVGSPHHRI